MIVWIDQNGIYSSIPHVMLVLCTFTSGYIADYLDLNPQYSTTFIRKLLTGFGRITLYICTVQRKRCNHDFKKNCFINTCNNVKKKSKYLLYSYTVQKMLLNEFLNTSYIICQYKILYF